MSYLCGRLVAIFERNRRSVEAERKEELYYHDCGGNLFFFPYTLNMYLRALDAFLEQRGMDFVGSVEMSDCRGLGHGYMVWAEKKN